MFDHEKAMTDAINAITRLNFRQLITLQASLAEHVFNVWQHAETRKATSEVEPSVDADRKPDVALKN